MNAPINSNLLVKEYEIDTPANAAWLNDPSFVGREEFLLNMKFAYREAYAVLAENPGMTPKEWHKHYVKKIKGITIESSFGNAIESLNRTFQGNQSLIAKSIVDSAPDLLEASLMSARCYRACSFIWFLAICFGLDLGGKPVKEDEQSERRAPVSAVSLILRKHDDVLSGEDTRAILDIIFEYIIPTLTAELHNQMNYEHWRTEESGLTQGIADYVSFLTMSRVPDNGTVLPDGSTVDIQGIVNRNLRSDGSKFEFNPSEFVFFWHHIGWIAHEPFFAEVRNLKLIGVNGVQNTTEVLTEISKRLYRENDPVFDKAQLKILNALMSEAESLSRYSIPYGAYVEVNLPPFTHVRIYQSRVGDTTMFFCDPNNEAARVIITPGNLPHAYLGMVGYTDPDKFVTQEDGITGLKEGEEISMTGLRLAITLTAAAIYRDFLVCEERVSVFGTPKYRQVFGSKDQQRRVIYMARYKYKFVGNKTDALDSLDLNKRSACFVNAHTRKLPQTHKPSPMQVALAKAAGVVLPEHTTYVRAHEVDGTDDNQARYRSRSAMSLLFEIIPGKEKKLLEDLSPMQFEELCVRYAKSVGLAIVRSGTAGRDRGIDISAIDASGRSVLIQCKHYAEGCGAPVIREMVGVKVRDGFDDVWVICSSYFTNAAIEEAAQLGVTLVDGTHVKHLIKNKAKS